MSIKTDRDLVRKLAAEVVEIAALPIQAERREIVRKIENLEPGRPPIFIYQEPWNELSLGEEMALKAEDPFYRGLELSFRRTLYRFRHYPDDASVGAEVSQKPCITDTGFGVETQVETLAGKSEGGVASHHFTPQIQEEADIEKIVNPVITHDPARTEAEFQKLCEVFDGVLPVVKRGIGGMWFAPWDKLVEWTGVQEILMDMALRPEYVHKLIDRFVNAHLARLDQYEALGLLQRPCMETWAVGAAQVFSEVSPAMHAEFALQYEARWFSRFKYTYYGCCEPLHNKVDIIREYVPNIRKLSMSPWIDFDRAVANVGRDIIFAWKPNPAMLAWPTWQPEAVRTYLREHLTKARNGGCVVEIHLKDISTVNNEPHRLDEWARIASEVVREVWA